MVHVLCGLNDGYRQYGSYLSSFAKTVDVLLCTARRFGILPDEGYPRHLS